MRRQVARSHQKDISPGIRQTKLYAVLERFSVYELNRFHKYLCSPYFNKKQQLVTFFEMLNTQLRNDDVAYTKHEIWSTLFADRPYDDPKFRRLCTDLLKRAEHFLAQEAYEDNPLHQADYLLQAVHKKGIEPLYNSAIKTARNLSRRQYLRPASFYYYQYEFERNYYTILGYEMKRSTITNIEAIVENLDKFYLAEKLRYYITVLSRRKIFDAHDYNVLFIDEIIEHIRSQKFDDIVPINFYYQIYLTYIEPEEKRHYDKLKRLIKDKILQLPEVEAREIIYSALNYCATMVNKGHAEFTSEYVGLYQEVLDKELLYINGHLSPWSFRNVISLALRSGEFDWVEDFITHYQDKLEPVYRENAVSFNLANLYFYKKQFDRVLDLLQTVEYEDPTYNLNSKVMLMFTYYELDEIDPLMSLLDSFKVYLRRHKDIPKARKQVYLDLIYYVRKLAKLVVWDKKGIQAFEDEIKTAKAIPNKSWLLEKLDELKG